MFKVNEDYLKLPGSYLFSTIGKKVAAFQEAMGVEATGEGIRTLSGLESAM